MISVLVPFYNAEGYLPILLNGLKNQIIPAGMEWELVAVDDGSTDHSIKIIESFGSILPLRLARSDKNYGRSISRNKCLELAKGDLLCFIDADMEPCPDWLKQYHDSFLSKEINVAIGATELASYLRDDLFRVYWNTRGIAKKKAGKIPYNYFYTSNCCLRRVVVEKVGLFDENFRTYGGEDNEYGYRSVKAGYKIEYVPKARTIHHNKSTMTQILGLLYEYGGSGLRYFVEKHPDATNMFRIDLVCSESITRRVWAFLLLSRFTRLLSTGLSRMPVPKIFKNKIYDLLVFQACARGFKGR